MATGETIRQLKLEQEQVKKWPNNLTAWWLWQWH